MCIRDSEKVLPSGHHIGDRLLAQALLDELCLAVGAIQHRDIREAYRVHRPDRTTGPAHPGLEHIHTADQAVDLFGDEQRLVKRIGRRQQPHPFPLAALCLQTGRGLARKAGQDRKRRADNRRGGPIVPEKGDLPKRRPFLPQPVETAGVGTTESINRLIRIPDDEEALPSPAPCPDEPELNGIDILEFVDEQMGEPAGSGSPLLRLQLDVYKRQEAGLLIQEPIGRVLGALCVPSGG